MSNGTLTDEKQGEDYQDYGMRHPPRISDWTLEDKILYTSLRREAFEYAVAIPSITADGVVDEYVQRDANQYLVDNFNYTLEELDNILLNEMNVQELSDKVMDWTELLPTKPDQNLARRILGPVIQMGASSLAVGQSALGQVEEVMGVSPENRIGPSYGDLLQTNMKLWSLGWEEPEDRNPLEPNPTQANRSAWVGEEGSLADWLVPRDQIELLIDLGLILAGGPIARGIVRVPRALLNAINRNSAAVDDVLSPHALSFLRKKGIINSNAQVTVKGKSPMPGTGFADDIAYRQTGYQDPVYGWVTTEARITNPELSSGLRTFLDRRLPRTAPRAEGSWGPGGPPVARRDPFTQQPLTPLAETATTDLALTTGAPLGRVTEDRLITIAQGDPVFSTANATYRQQWNDRGISLTVRDSGGIKSNIVTGSSHTPGGNVVYVSPEDAVLLRMFWDKHHALPPVFPHMRTDYTGQAFDLTSTLDYTTLPEVGRVPVIYNQGSEVSPLHQIQRFQPVVGGAWPGPEPTAYWKGYEFLVVDTAPAAPLQNAGAAARDVLDESALTPEVHIGEPITYVDPRAVNEIAQISGVMQQVPLDPVNREVANALARRNIETLLETAAPSWEDGVTLFHGTQHDFTNFDVSRTAKNALYGQGIYATVDPAIAVSYSQNSGITNFVHRVEWTGSAPPKILDIEAPLPAEVREALRPLESRAIEPADLSTMDDAAASAGWGAPETVYSTMDLGLDDPTTTWRSIDNAWNGAHSYTTRGHDTLRQVLLDLNYDAMTHTGGVRGPGRAVGADPHQVVIWIDDANIKSGGRAVTTGFVSQEGDLMRAIVRSPEEARAAQTRYLGEDWESLTDEELARFVDRSTPALEPGYQGPPGPGGMTMAADIPVPPVGPEDALAFAQGRTILPVRRIMSTHPLTALPHELQMPPPWGTSNVAKADAMVVFDRLEGGEVSHTVTPFLTAAEEAGIPVFNFREQHAATGGVEEMTAAALQDFLKANNVESLFVTGDTGWDTIGSRINHHLGLTFGNQFTPSQRALPELPGGVTMEVSRQFFTPELLRANPNKYYLFGENVKAHDAGSMAPGGPDSGAAIIRGQPNAIGIPTKSTTREYMTDDAYGDNIEKIDEGFAKIPEGGVVVVHQDRGGYTLGTGRADLRNKAPRTWDYLQARLDQLGSAGFGSSSGFSPSLYLPSQPAETGPVVIKHSDDLNPVLSNFERSPFEFRGQTFESAEAAYQSHKSGEFVAGGEGLVGSDARSFGQILDTDQSITEPLMKEIVVAKFEQVPEFREALLATGDRTLTHPVTGHWREAFPRILMEVRDEALAASPGIPAETAPAGWPTYKHFTTPEGKAGLIESGGIHDFTKPPAHGVGSGKGLGPRTERAGGDYLYLSLDDAHWGSYDVDTGVGVVIPNKWVLPDETGMSHGLPKPDTDPASVKKYYGSDITDRGHNHLMPGPNTWNYKLLEQEYQRIEAEGIETRGFYDYDAQEWRVEAGGAIRTELEPVDYAIDPSARRLVIDSDESYLAALEEAESIGGQSVRLHDITPGTSGWEALEERYDIVEIRNVSEHLDGRWRKFWQTYGSDQIIVLNPDVARMVSSPETPTPQAASPGIPAETGPSVALDKIISGGQTGADQAGLFAAEQLGIPTGGTGTKGFRVEGGTDTPLLRDRFGLVEHSEKDYMYKTIENIEQSDGTVLFYPSTGDAGTGRTEQLLRGETARTSGRDWKVSEPKPYIVITGNSAESRQQLVDFIQDNDIRVLNVAGNRGSLGGPQFQENVQKFLVQALGEPGSGGVSPSVPPSTGVDPYNATAFAIGSATELINMLGPAYAEFIDDPLFREFVVLVHRTGLAEKDPRIEPFSEETQALLKEGIAISGDDWEAFSRSRGYTEKEIADFRRYLEVEGELSAKYPDDPDFTAGIAYELGLRSPLSDPPGTRTPAKPDPSTRATVPDVSARLSDFGPDGSMAQYEAALREYERIHYYLYGKVNTVPYGPEDRTELIAHVEFLREFVNDPKFVDDPSAHAVRDMLKWAEVQLSVDRPIRPDWGPGDPEWDAAKAQFDIFSDEVNSRGSAIGESLEYQTLDRQQSEELLQGLHKEREAVAHGEGNQSKEAMRDLEAWIEEVEDFRAGGYGSDRIRAALEGGGDVSDSDENLAHLKRLWFDEQDDEFKRHLIEEYRHSVDEGWRPFDANDITRKEIDRALELAERRVDEFVAEETAGLDAELETLVGKPGPMSNVDPIVLQELERVRGKLTAFKTEHGYPNTAVYRTPGIRDYYIPTKIHDWVYTSAQLQAYDDIFPEHAGAGNRIIWLPDDRNLGLYQNLYKMKRKEVGAHIVQEIWRFDRLLTRYAELMGFTE